MINAVYKQLPSKYVEYADVHFYKGEYDSLNNCLESCYNICYQKGADIPAQRTIENLSGCIASIHTSIPNLNETIFQTTFRSGNDTYKNRLNQLCSAISVVNPVCFEICEKKTSEIQDKNFYNLPNGISQISSSSTKMTRVHTRDSIHDRMIVGKLTFDQLGVGRDELTKIEIGDCVYEIDDNAFDGCSNLSTVSITRNTKTVGDNTFVNCGVKNIILFDTTLSGILYPRAFMNVSAYVYCEDGRMNFRTRTGQPSNKSAIFSDIHQTLSGTSEYNKTWALKDLKRAFEMVKRRNIGKVFICGDIGTNGWGGSGQTKKPAEIDQFKNISENEGSGLSIGLCGGNHDWNYSDSEWNNWFGHNKNYYTEDVDGINAYVFLSITHLNDDGGRDYKTPYDLTWFEQTMLTLSSKRVFVFMHYPMNSGTTSWHYAGVIPTTKMWDGFESTLQTNEIIRIAKQHGRCMIFSGHSHYAFEIDDEVGNLNTYEFSDSNVKLVHVPSLAYPRDKNRTNINEGNPSRQPAQGYIMDTYGDTVLLKCFNSSFLASDDENGNEITRWSYIFEI